MIAFRRTSVRIVSAIVFLFLIATVGTWLPLVNHMWQEAIAPHVTEVVLDLIDNLLGG